MSGKPNERDPNTFWTVVVLCAFAIVTFASVIFLQAIFFHVEKKEIEEKVVNRLPDELIELREKQSALLSSYGWTDRDAGAVTIPIDRAMELVVEENGGGDAK